jgi:hypothetical protein
MKEKIQLKHPEGKKAISMDPDKYEVLKSALIKFLSKHPESTHDQIYQAVVLGFKETKVKFEGSIEWNLEWVKLDLEARNIIKRTSTKSPIKLSLC